MPSPAKSLLAFLAASLLAGVPFGALAQYPFYNIDDGAKYTSLPFDWHNGFIVVEVRLEGKLPAKFILDSGAAHTILIYREFTDLLGVGYERSVTIRGVDRKTQVPAFVSEPMRLTLEGVTAHSQRIIVMKESNITFDKYTGVEISGILGMDLFRRFDLRLDYLRKQIHLYEPGQRKNWEAQGYSPLGVEISNGKMYFLSSLRIRQSEGKRQTRWLVDTGAALSLLLHGSEADSTLLPPLARPGNIGRGLGGFVLGYKGRGWQFAVQEHDMGDFICNFQVLPDSIYGKKSPRDTLDGIVGNHIWQQFDMVFQFHKKRIWLRPNAKFGASISNDRTGLGIVASGLDLRQYTVEEVLPDSPAAEAGLLPGDEILKVGWWPADIYSLGELLKRINKKKNKRCLKIKRGDKKLRIRLTPERYL